jgi:three-Cys-motif partner protein
MAKEKKLTIDEIGPWSEVKLEIIKKYAYAYSQIMTSGKMFNHIYIDAFAGTGVHLSKNTKEYVLGSPLNALHITHHLKNIT